VTVHAREAAHQRLAVELLELVEARAVHQARDQLTWVVGRPRVGRDRAGELGGIDQRVLGRRALPRRRLAGAKRGHDRAHCLQCLQVVAGQVIGHAGAARVQLASAQLLGGHLLAGGRLHQRRAAQEDRPLLAHDHGLVAHRGHVRAACRARPHDHRDLRDALGGHRGLVEEDAAEVPLVGEDLVLHGQEGPARVDQVHTREAVLPRDLLRAQMLLDGHREVGAALDRGVVGHDDHLAPRDPADAGDDACPRRLVIVEAVGGQRRQLQEGRARVEQPLHPLARQQLAARDVTLGRLLPSPGA
jgi:hypothetical protein